MSARLADGARAALRRGFALVRGRRVLACAVVMVTGRSEAAARCEGDAVGTPADVVALAAFLLTRVRDSARAEFGDDEASPDLLRVEAALAQLTGPRGRLH